MFNYHNLDLFATRFNHKLPLYVSPVLDNHAFAIDAFSMNWNHIHAYAFPPTILIPCVLNKIRQSQCRIVLIATTSLVLRGPTTTCLSSSSSSSCSNFIKSGKAPTSELPSSQPSRVGVIKQSIRDKNKFRKTLRILSPNQDEHQFRKYMTRNGSFIPVGVIERRLIRSRSFLL